jgi:DNA-binding response OmpR family regulator
MTRILVVEDDPAILRGLADNLQFEGYDVITAADGESGYRTYKKDKPDLIVLDLMLPRVSGLELCRKVRAEGSHVPIVMLTARSEESDRILGFDLGADDYVTKPFSIRELIARVRAILRRKASFPQLPDNAAFGEVEIDFLRYMATRNGKPLEMTRKEFAVIRYLVSRCGEVVSRDELLNEVWGYEAYPVSRTVDNHIAGIRAKLEPDPAHPRFILTVHGVGYRFVSPLHKNCNSLTRS